MLLILFSRRQYPWTDPEVSKYIGKMGTLYEKVQKRKFGYKRKTKFSAPETNSKAQVKTSKQKMLCVHIFIFPTRLVIFIC